MPPSPADEVNEDAVDDSDAYQEGHRVGSNLSADNPDTWPGRACRYRSAAPRDVLRRRNWQQGFVDGFRSRLDGEAGPAPRQMAGICRSD